MQAYKEVKGSNITSYISTGVCEFILNSLRVFQGCQLRFRYFKHFLSPASKTSECVVWNTRLNSFPTTALTCWLYSLPFASPIFSSNYSQTKTALSGLFLSFVFESLHAASSGMQLPVSHPCCVTSLLGPLLVPNTNQEPVLPSPPRGWGRVGTVRRGTVTTSLSSTGAGGKKAPPARKTNSLTSERSQGGTRWGWEFP